MRDIIAIMFFGLVTVLAWILITLIPVVILYVLWHSLLVPVFHAPPISWFQTFLMLLLIGMVRGTFSIGVKARKKD